MVDAGASPAISVRLWSRLRPSTRTSVAAGSPPSRTIHRYRRRGCSASIGEAEIVKLRLLGAVRA